MKNTLPILRPTRLSVDNNVTINVDHNNNFFKYENNKKLIIWRCAALAVMRFGFAFKSKHFTTLFAPGRTYNK